MNNKKALLIILDGFGNAPKGEFNAVTNAHLTYINELKAKYPMSELITHGLAVGLPEGIMGNSEVGHTTLGAGRVVYQDLTRILKSIKDGDFFTNPELVKTVQAAKAKTGRVHLMGLLSDGGVHSHIEHVEALLTLCAQQEIPNVSVHCFLDGRDTPPESSLVYVERLLKHPTFSGKGKTKAVIAMVSGRFWAMDRDKRWERVQKAYMTMTGQVAAQATTALEAIKKSHAEGKTDEFVEPILLHAEAAMKDGDGVIFFNYRSDRAREISAAIGTPGFKDFDRGHGFKPSAFVGMTQYEKNLEGITVAYGPQNLDNIFGLWLEKHKLTQFRTAETEKYAHVTFFFNGGREAPFVGEDRLLVQSPKEVATYDLKPEMSAFAVAEGLTAKIKENKYDFMLVNFANPDMVGHTGNYDAVVNALQALDKCMAQVVPAALASGYEILITADHGNSEEMRDSEGRLHTQHTLNPVPLLWVSERALKAGKNPLRSGSLEDIMPTLCFLMGIPVPKEATGKCLIQA